MRDEIIKESAFCRFGVKIVEDKLVKALARNLEISAVEAAGYVALLVGVGISCATDGGELDLSARRIEDACRWEGMTGELFNAFRFVAILIGDRDDAADPLRFNPNIWRDYAFDAIKQRTNARRRQADKRERDRAAKQAEFDKFMDMSRVTVTCDSNA